MHVFTYLQSHNSVGMSVFALVCVFGLQCVSELLFQFSYSFVHDDDDDDDRLSD